MKFNVLIAHVALLSAGRAGSDAAASYAFRVKCVRGARGDKRQHTHCVFFADNHEVLITTHSTAAAVTTAAAAAPATCDAAGIAAAALAPGGGPMPNDWVGTLSPKMLFFQVLADFSYSKDFVAGTRRKDVAPCLKAWGAQAVVRLKATVSDGMNVCLVGGGEA